MYIPNHFLERNVDALHKLIDDFPLATLVINGSDGLDADHIPMFRSGAIEPGGTLFGHVARANPLWKVIGDGSPVLAIFHGPNSYISPSWYETKKEHGRVVPTWNYAVVHVHGTLRAVDDTGWLRTHLEKMTDQNEAAFAEPWRVGDAPADYVEKMLRAIVGIELAVTRVIGKTKMSQNQPRPNQKSLIDGLDVSANADSKRVSEAMRAKLDTAG
jgi:transcriptional regulator